MRSVVVIGACYLDTILTVPYYPHEDEKLRAKSLSKRRGGNGPNTLELLTQLVTARHFHKTQYLSLYLCSVLPSKVSPDVSLIKASLGPAVDLSTCIYRQDCTEAASSYILQSSGSGSRTLVNYNNLSEMTVEEFDQVSDKVTQEVGPTGQWYHFEGRTPDVTLDCIRSLRRKLPDVAISVELEKPGRAGLEELAAEADVVFYSQSWAKSKGYKSHEQCLRAQAQVAQRASLLLCTWGGDGSAGFRPSTGQLVQMPAYKLQGKPLIDSTGAGDAFIAGILFAFLIDGSDRSNQDSISQGGFPPILLVDMLEFANEVAGRKVVQHGFSGIADAINNPIK